MKHQGMYSYQNVSYSLLNIYTIKLIPEDRNSSIYMHGSYIVLNQTLILFKHFVQSSTFSIPIYIPQDSGILSKSLLYL